MIFYRRVSNILPSAVRMSVPQQRNTLYSHDFKCHSCKWRGYRFLLKDVKMLIQEMMDFYHVFKTHHNVQYSLFNEQSFYKPQNESSPLCFVTSVCKVGEMHIGLPSDASTNLLEVDFFKKYMDNDWEVKFKALSLYKYSKTYIA